MNDEHRLGPDRVLVLADEELQFAITWNGSLTFNVWTALTNGFATRLLVEVDVFTASEVSGSVDVAERVAADWWEDYGRHGRGCEYGRG